MFSENLGPKVTRADRRAQRLHRKEIAIVDHLVAASEEFGEQSVRDMFTATRLATDKEHPEMSGLVWGVLAESERGERLLFQKLMGVERHLGRDGLEHAFGRYVAKREYLHAADTDDTRSPENKSVTA